MSVTPNAARYASTRPPEQVMGRYHPLLRYRLLLGVLLLVILASLILDFTPGPSGLTLNTLWHTLLHNNYLAVHYNFSM